MIMTTLGTIVQREVDEEDVEMKVVMVMSLLPTYILL
jgi:hypothetical protein